MNKYSFVVDVVAGDLDREVVVDSISECLRDTLPSDVVANVKSGAVKAFSEQGYKVYRARVLGITAEQAGDAASPKSKAKAEAEEALV
jgi:hypothetical protein